MSGLVPAVQERITNVAVSFSFAGRMFVVGRGAEFATAREIALKLLETCRVAAEPLTGTGLAHGPVDVRDDLTMNDCAANSCRNRGWSLSPAFVRMTEPSRAIVAEYSATLSAAAQIWASIASPPASSIT